MGYNWRKQAMLTNLLNSLLLQKLASTPFSMNTSRGHAIPWSYCSDGSCSGDCVGGCDGTPAGGF